MFGVPTQRRRGGPRVFAPRAGGREDGLVSELVRRPRHLREVVDVGGTTAYGRTEANDLAAVAGGRQKPVDVDAHRSRSFTFVGATGVEHLYDVTGQGDGGIGGSSLRQSAQIITIVYKSDCPSQV